jgi:hypothetical protein
MYVQHASGELTWLDTGIQGPRNSLHLMGSFASNFISEICTKIYRETPDWAECERIMDILPEDLSSSYIVGSDT